MSIITPIQVPLDPLAARIDRLVSGPPLAPITRVRTFSFEDWEAFIHEWADSLRSDYFQVYRCGGAGDMGRDVVAHTAEPNDGKEWDNYQCKHYDHALQPSEIWIELGKLVYFTFKKEFTIPRRYFFVAPHDVGAKLSKLIEQPELLRKNLIKEWDSKCRNRIRSVEVPLTGALKSFLDEFPFEIVAFKPVLKVIEQHAATPWHVHRFGGGLPNRPDVPSPPKAFGPEEVRYVTELLRAYSNAEGDVVTEGELEQFPAFQQHFRLSRKSFYFAEALKTFSRDHLPESEFDRLQEEVLDGVQESYLSEHSDGFQKALNVTKAAVNLPITDHALLPVLRSADRRGICHQLVDLRKLIWVDSNG